MLESPAPGATLSGIGFISGWKCDGQQITVRIDDGPPLPVLYGNERLDTHVSRGGPCPHHQTGYILQMNWAELGNGSHTAIAYDNHVEFARSGFTVRGFRDPFVTGAAATVPVPDFPLPGDTAVFAWQQSTQHLELVDAFTTPTTPAPRECEGWPPTPTTVHADGTTTGHRGHYESVEWVSACLEAGADPNAREEETGNTPLFHLFGPTSGQIASLLLDAGADPHARNKQGKSPLHQAMRSFDHGDLELIVVLLDAGADPNARDLNGDPPLNQQWGWQTRRRRYRTGIHPCGRRSKPAERSGGALWL